MSDLKNPLGRREFLMHAVAVASIPTGIAAGAASTGTAVDPGATIPTRVLGKTKVTLPILGYGGAALPKVWGNPHSLDDRVKLVRYAFDRGIRYYDTAGNYMESQGILGEALKDVRDQIYLVSKVETTKPAQARRAVEKSLKELQTDHLNAILIHGTPGIEQID